ncbi:hypothetical protein BC938DRAFT_481986 [Jimgerdemannia flammicorona]|uniref:Uncharacterized protein n=1 Tax=Jimgerdemannia flammicorona TaxID=994334 RepID=A0A433QEV1_9FUNG|nr:hypothetical protein BC938DRAFT_481986 [Jimgerdemannia flammicorona]
MYASFLLNYKPSHVSVSADIGSAGYFLDQSGDFFPILLGKLSAMNDAPPPYGGPIQWLSVPNDGTGSMVVTKYLTNPT